MSYQNKSIDSAEQPNRQKSNQQTVQLENDDSQNSNMDSSLLDQNDKQAANNTIKSKPVCEFGGPKGPEPTRYGDWESKGRCHDF